MSNELPEPWGSKLAPKGVHSYGDLAERLGISKGTAHRLIVGQGEPSVRTVQKVADAFFAGDLSAVYRLRGSMRKGYGPWSPPAEVVLLSPKQRAALEAVIAAMLPSDEAGGGEGEQAPANRPPDMGPASQRRYPKPVVEAARKDKEPKD